MTLRFISATVVVAALVGAFALGRASSPQIASAQTPSLSHFMCYMTEIAPAGSGAGRITDQFGTTTRKFLRPDMFCAPARKIPVGFKPRPIPGNADHLTCYHTEGAQIAQSHRIFNQLQAGAFKGLTPRYFCLPTFKDEKQG